MTSYYFNAISFFVWILINFFHGKTSFILAESFENPLDDATQSSNLNQESRLRKSQFRYKPVDVRVLSQPTSRPSAFSAPTPFIISASLSADGRYCSLTFDSPTNKAGMTSSEFSCSSFLSFLGNDVATCLWSDASTISVYPDLTTADHIAEALNVGSVITMLSNNNIYNVKCGNNIATMPRSCVSSMQQTVFVLGPMNPVPPSVSIISSTFISACAPWRLDLTGSTGDGQRGWVATVQATGTNSSLSTLPLQKFIQNHANNTKVPFAVPASYLHVGETYTVKITLCNIFFDCASKTIAVTGKNFLAFLLCLILHGFFFSFSLV
jgi:hypothetical protein